jgi:signal transduction histidine kinase
VDAVLAGARELILPHVERQGIRFDVAAADPELTVFADSERLQQILLNLLMNAAKFTPAGGSVRLFAEPRDAAVHLHVEDTGCGIPDAQLERVFEPFVQLERAVNRESQQGVGLGLAISRDLARRMAGDVVAMSQPGRGSRFTVVLPRQPVA